MMVLIYGIILALPVSVIVFLVSYFSMRHKHNILWNTILFRCMFAFYLGVLFAITFDLSKVSMLIVFVLILAMIGVVYVKNKLFYINPFLNILGFNFYNITYKEEGEDKELTTKIFFKGDLLINKHYWVKIKDENFSFVDSTKMNKEKGKN